VGWTSWLLPATSILSELCNMSDAACWWAAVTHHARGSP
jgi:hypothetical protein